MALFGRKKKDKNDSSEEGANTGELSLENEDDDDDNDEESRGAVAVAERDDDDDDEDDDEDEDEDEEDGGEAEDEGLDPDLLDIFTDDDGSDLDLAALTEGLENVTAASLLELAQEVVASLRKQASTAGF